MLTPGNVGDRAGVAFVHINKTGGSSIEQALGLRFRHRTARELIEECGRDAWDRLFTFAVVRNPWDKAVSHYHYRVQTNQTGLGNRHLDFRAWVRESYGARNPVYYDKPKFFMSQMEWITDADGTVLVGFVGRFERLEADFQEICRRLNRSASLPHLKRSVHQDYRAYYDSESANIIADWFRRDVEHFGYRFE